MSGCISHREKNFSTASVKHRIEDTVDTRLRGLWRKTEARYCELGLTGVVTDTIWAIVWRCEGKAQVVGDSWILEMPGMWHLPRRPIYKKREAVCARSSIVRTVGLPKLSQDQLITLKASNIGNGAMGFKCSHCLVLLYFGVIFSRYSLLRSLWNNNF